VVFADDLNCWKEIPLRMGEAEAFGEAKECQNELHKWGKGNSVSFDPVKESMHVVSHVCPAGDNFNVLGVVFDPRLVMEDAVTSLVRECRWKLAQLLRGQAYFEVEKMVRLYKAHFLSFIEYRTAALYHASCSVLLPLDRMQQHFLKEIGLTEEVALVDFNLAPLNVRRDIGMLGVIHRAVLRKGPPQLWRFFEVVEVEGEGPVTRRRDGHRLQLRRYKDGDHLEVLARSVLGLVDVYNELPKSVVETCSEVKFFQRQLQALVKL